MGIRIHNVNKRYKDFQALNNVSLNIGDGELIALLGPSGSGKTTLLRMIAGLDTPDNGEIIVQGKTRDGQNLRERNVGFVFQHYALFKHMSVFENVAFGLRVRPKETRPSDEAIAEKVMQLLRMVHLDQFAQRYPSQLSGGQRQRVALARALAVEPSVLLLDEPFGALDAKVRKELRRWMRRLHEELHITSVFVTHDQEEAMEMADRVVVMSHGRIEQAGTPEEVYLTPKNAFVYDFLGHYNEFAAWQQHDGSLVLEEDVVPNTAAKPATFVTDTKAEWLKRAADEVQHIPLLGGMLRGFKKFKEEAAPILAAAPAPKTYSGTRVTAFCRPHELYIATEVEEGTIAARIIHINPAGPLVKLELERASGALLDAELPKTVCDRIGLKKGQDIFVRPKEMKIFA